MEAHPEQEIKAVAPTSEEKLLYQLISIVKILVNDGARNGRKPPIANRKGVLFAVSGILMVVFLIELQPVLKKSYLLYFAGALEYDYDYYAELFAMKMQKNKTGKICTNKNCTEISDQNDFNQSHAYAEKLEKLVETRNKIAE